MLIAKREADGSIRINTVFTGPDAYTEAVLLPGQAFGGHSYEEWLQIATLTGSVSADWLDVYRPRARRGAWHRYPVVSSPCWHALPS